MRPKFDAEYHVSRKPIKVEQLKDGRVAYHIYYPRVTMHLPAGRNDIYEPVGDKATIDAASLFTHHYADALPGRTILELGCGDFALIAHVTKALDAARVMATDVDPKAIDILTAYGSPDITYRQSDLFGNVGEERFDMIVFNPPQMPMPHKQRAQLTDWHDSPGPKGYEMILQTLDQADRYLADNGKLVMMMFDFLTTDGVIADTARKRGFTTRRLGKVVKPVRPGGKTEQALPYIRTVFPDTLVHDDDKHGRHISATLSEFTRANTR